jgi:hypothetical protein
MGPELFKYIGSKLFIFIKQYYADTYQVHLWHKDMFLKDVSNYILVISYRNIQSILNFSITASRWRCGSIRLEPQPIEPTISVFSVSRITLQYNETQNRLTCKYYFFICCPSRKMPRWYLKQPIIKFLLVFPIHISQSLRSSTLYNRRSWKKSI